MFEKIVTTLFKEEMKKITGKKHKNIMYQDGSDGFVYACIEGTRLHRIIKEDFILDYSRLNKNSNIVKIFNDCLEKNKKEAYSTGYTREYELGLVAEFKTRDGESFFYDSKILKEFGKANELVLYVDKGFSPAVVENVELNGLLTGLICPVNIKAYQ